MKLVRDRIPELAATNGHPGAFHQATEAEFALWLRAKLLEEAREAATASAGRRCVEELGDVLQVLYALAAEAGYCRGRDRVRPRPQGPHPRHLHPPPPLAPAHLSAARGGTRGAAAKQSPARIPPRTTTEAT